MQLHPALEQNRMDFPPPENNYTTSMIHIENFETAKVGLILKLEMRIGMRMMLTPWAQLQDEPY